jgi:hypothetical protein
MIFIPQRSNTPIRFIHKPDNDLILPWLGVMIRHMPRAINHIEFLGF